MATQTKGSLTHRIVAKSQRIGELLSGTKCLLLLLSFLGKQSVVQRHNEAAALLIRLLPMAALTVQDKIPDFFLAVAKLFNNGSNNIFIDLARVLIVISILLPDNYMAV